MRVIFEIFFFPSFLAPLQNFLRKDRNCRFTNSWDKNFNTGVVKKSLLCSEPVGK